MRTRMQLAPVSLWIARLVWAALPLTAGVAAADALDGWSTAPGLLAAALLWLAWAVGLVALLAPRPLGLTALRAIAPAFVGLAIVAAAASTDGWTIVAIAATVLAAACVLAHRVAIASVDGASYGDERRFPLQIPPALFLGPLPLAPAVIAAGVATGPLLLADGRLVAGLVALVGLLLAALAARSLHTLSQRFVVLVPAGIAIVDPFTLSDPVLLLRERIRSLHVVDARQRPTEGAVDLRLGATSGTAVVTLDRTTDTLQVRRGRGRAETVKTDELWFAVVGSRELVALAGDRRIPTR